MQIITHGIVLKARDINNGRLLNLLTRDLGVISVFTKPNSKLQGKLMSSCEPMCYSQFKLFKRKDFYSLDESAVENNFFDLSRDIEKLALASYLGELCYELAPKDEPAPEYLRLMLNSLHLLSSARRSARFVKAVFELRIMTMAGFMPDLLGCSSCGEFQREVMYFLPSSAKLLCSECAVKQLPEEALQIDVSILSAMRHIIYSSGDKLFNFTLTDAPLKRMGEIIEWFTILHMGNKAKTLEFYKSFESF